MAVAVSQRASKRSALSGRWSGASMLFFTFIISSVFMKHRHACAVLVAGLFAISGCASKSPEKDAGAYGDAVASVIKPSEQHAQIIFKTSGAPMIVEFSMGPFNAAGEGLRPVGRVFDSGREVLLPWIAKLTEKANRGLVGALTSRSVLVAAGQLIQIRGESEWSDSDGIIRRSGACGPLISYVVPAGARSYLVVFKFNGHVSCNQEIYDITDPERKELVVGPMSST